MSVVVCVRNCAGLLPLCLDSVRDNSPHEVVVVDGASSDGTVAMARRYTDRILDDEGNGLAYARNLGARAATGRYVAFVGPDNILPSDTIERMVQAKEANGWTGVSAVTRLHQPDGYLARSMDRYKLYRFTPGERPVIGTPTLFDADVLREYLFDGSLTSSDDSDLCERMGRDGLRFGISTAVVFEQGTTRIGSMVERWRWYGQSDAEFFAKYSSGWGLSRKVESLLHPVRAELLNPGRAALAAGDVAIVPFLAGITLVRYAGWLERAVHARRRA